SCYPMGRCLLSAAAPAAGGEQREQSSLCAPAIYYLEHHNGHAGWAARLAQAARLGFDHVCLNAFLTHRDDPLLVVEFDRPHPGWGLRGSLADAVHELATLCTQQGLRLCLDVVLDRLAADGRAAQQADGLFERRHQSDVVDPRLDPTLV